MVEFLSFINNSMNINVSHTKNLYFQAPCQNSEVKVIKRSIRSQKFSCQHFILNIKQKEFLKYLGYLRRYSHLSDWIFHCSKL